MRKTLSGLLSLALCQSFLPTRLLGGSQDAESLLFEDIPVVVTATKTEQPITEAPASATVISGERLKNMGAVTLADALKTIPGVYISSSERHLARIHIRGIGNTVSSYNDKVLLLIDGTPQRELVFGHAFIDEYLPVDNIKRIEVIKGPGSALYGTNAFGGVINVITKDAADVNGTEVAGGFGTAQTRMGSAITGRSIRQADVLLFARAYQTKGDGQEYASRSQRNSLQQDPVNAESYWLKTRYKGLSFDAKYLELVHGFHTNWDLPETSWDRNTFNYRDVLLDVKYEKAVTGWLEGMAKVWWRDNDNFNFWQKTSGFSITADVYPLKKTSLLGAQTELKVKAPFRQHWIAGIQFDYEKLEKVIDIEITRATGREVSPSPFFIAPTTHKNYGLYFEDIWKPLDWLDVTAGVRNDVNGVFGNFVSPRGGIVARPAERTAVKLLYGEAFRAPSNRELYTITSDFAEGNKDLQPEKIRTAEVELNHQWRKGLRSQLNYYQNRVTNSITQTLVGTRNRWINDSGLTIIEGIEHQTEYVSGKTRAFFNYSWMDARDKNGDVLPNIPIHTANLGVELPVFENLSVHPTLLFVGDRPRRSDDRNSSARDNRFPTGQRRPAIERYTVINLPLVYTYKNLEAVMAVTNLLNQQYFDPHESVQSRDIERPGRNFLAKASYKF